MEKPSGIRTCSVEGCNKKHLARGFCLSHYQKDRYHSVPRVREKQYEYLKEYYSRPENKERRRIRKNARNLSRVIRDMMNKDKHATCKKLGKPMNHILANPHYNIRCTSCNVSYSNKKPEIFYKKNKCPCCHRMLRIRPGIIKKRSLRNLD